MKWARRSLMIAFVGSWLFCPATSTEAFYIDGQKTLSFKAKAQTRLSIRLNDADGWTFPDAKVGDLVQWRNLALIELDHNLKTLTRELGLLYPLKALKIKSKYHLVGRFIYDAVYDVGPQIFQNVKERDKGNIDSFSHQYELWEFYFDLSRGPWFLRIGRQSLAWGETDIFRLLDGINPLDNTFGGPFEDLDDRRIPLWMLRGTYNLGDIGPIYSLTLEGFWVPGFWDARVAPFAPFGTPYAAPLPAPFAPFVRLKTPDKDVSNSRWGVRLQGMLGTNVNFSVAHYKTFQDTQTLRSVVVQDVPVLTDLNDMILEVAYSDVQVTGGSVSFWESHTDVIVRSEVALFWDEAVFIQEENLATLYGPTLALPPPLMDLAAQVLGIDLRDLGLDGLPLDPQSGGIPKKNILRFLVGLDKQMWIRRLNETNTFFLSMQYFGQWIPDYDERMAQSVPIYPDLIVFPEVKETEHIFTMVLSTMYRKGTIIPQMAVAYDVRGAWLVQPSVNLIREPFRFMLQYSAIEGNFTSFGVFRDRDQISFIFTYLLN
jgi:hypothetical protein